MDTGGRDSSACVFGCRCCSGGGQDTNRNACRARQNIEYVRAVCCMSVHAPLGRPNNSQRGKKKKISAEGGT